MLELNQLQLLRDYDDNLNEYMDYTQSIRNHYHFKALKDKLSAYNK